MIDKKFYRRLLIAVNDPTFMPLMLEYVDERIEVLRSQLETSKDLDRVREIQGSIHELRRFKTLRDEVIKGAE